MSDFSAQIKEFSRKYEAKLRAVARTAVQETVSMAQRTTGEGGRMRIDTGFLRASMQGALGGMPVGQSDNPKKQAYAAGSNASGEPLAVTLLKWDPAKEISLFVGWTANYARYREAKDGFLRGAAEQWDRTVINAVKTVEKTLG